MSCQVLDILLSYLETISIYGISADNVVVQCMADKLLIGE